MHRYISPRSYLWPLISVIAAALLAFYPKISQSVKITSFSVLLLGASIQFVSNFKSSQNNVAAYSNRDTIETRINSYTNIFEAFSIGIIISDTNGKIVSHTPAVEKLFGYAKSELEHLSIEDLLPDSLRQNHHKDRKEYFSNPSNRLMGVGRDLVGVRKDGTFFPIEIGLSLLSYANTAHVSSVIVDISKRKAAEDQIKNTLEEKETLLKEIHHRVKNNLQSLVSLINLQIGSNPSQEITTTLSELQGRIQAIALIHESLYQSANLDEIEFDKYVRELVTNLVHSIGANPQIKTIINIPPLVMNIHMALPCGLIINELVTNSLKYAFPAVPATDQRITINFRKEATNYYLEVKDNGAGLPDNFSWQSSNSLGLKLVNIWATHQLQGAIRKMDEPGTSFSISFNAIS